MVFSFSIRTALCTYALIVNDPEKMETLEGITLKSVFYLFSLLMIEVVPIVSMTVYMIRHYMKW